MDDVNPHTRKRERDAKLYRLLRTCRHYQGTVRGGLELHCALGLNIRELTGDPEDGWLLRIPCNRMPLPSYAAGIVKAKCDRFEPHTEEV